MSDTQQPIEDSDEDKAPDDFDPLSFPNDIPESVWKDIPPEDRKELVFRIVQIRESYSGPIPHPRIIKGYEDILPGSANRILSMAEQQQQHRHELEKLVIFSDKRLESWGLVGGFTLATIVLVGGFLAILNGMDVVGVGIVGSTAVALFVAYRTERQRREIDRANKREELEGKRSPSSPGEQSNPELPSEKSDTDKASN